MFLEVFAENVQKIRNDKGWTISRAAREAKINWKQLSAIENCEGKPTVRTLYKMSINWNVPISRFLKGYKEV